MKNKTAIFKGILVLFILLISLSGCSKLNKESILNANSPVTISVWHYYNGAQKTAFDDLILKFNETMGKDRGIIVQSFSKGGVNELSQSVKDAAMEKVGADKMPDIFATYSDTAKEINDMGLLASIDKYFTKEELDEYISSYIEEGKIDSNGSIKIIPVAKSTELLFINKTDWNKFSDACGVTNDDLLTWEGVAKVAEIYYKYSNGKAFLGRDAIANYMLVGSKQLGEEIFKIDNGKATINLDEKVMKKLWDNFYTPFVSGYYGKHGRFASDDTKTGDNIAYIGSSSSVTYFPLQVTIGDEKPYPIECMVLPLPNFESTKKMAVQQGAGFSISKNTEAKEYACAVFLKWLTSTEQDKVYSIKSSYLPVKKSSNNFEQIKKTIDDEKINASDALLNSLKVAVDQVNTYSLYVSKAFYGGFEARKILENSMIDIAIEDFEKIKAEANNAENKKEIISKYSEESFEIWMDEIKEKLEMVLTY